MSLGQICLGVTFDSKLTWSVHVAKAISKAYKSLIALRQLKKLFTPTEMRALLDANYYSVLYYNAISEYQALTTNR